MAKIWLNAGHGGDDPGACANGRSEAVQVEKLTRAVGSLLSGVGHTVWYTRDVSPHMATYVPHENNKPADIFVSFHQNAGGGRGYESFVSGNDNCALACAKALAEDMAKIWPLRGSTYGAGVKNHTEAAVGSLYVVSGTVSPSFLGEFGFIDSATDMKIFDDNFDYIARCCANRISLAVGGKSIGHTETKKDTETKTEVTKVDWKSKVTDLYITQLGREPDPEGLAFWENILNKGTLSWDEVANGIIDSDEGRRRFIRELYVFLLKREPDEKGMNDWMDAIVKGMTRAEIYKAFVESDEYKNKK